MSTVKQDKLSQNEIETSVKWVKPSGFEIQTNDLKASVELAESLGWKRKLIIDPDKGDGVPGSSRWHKVQIMSFDSKEEIACYVKEVSGQSLDKRGSLYTVKMKAVEVLCDE